MSTDNHQPQNPNLEQEEGLLDNPDRRKLLKRVAIGGVTALAAGVGLKAAGSASVEGRVDPSVLDVDDAAIKPKDQRDVMLTYASSPALGKKYPERNEIYSKANNKQYNHQEGFAHYAFMKKHHRYDNNKPGYTQLDLALAEAGWSPMRMQPEKIMAMPIGSPNSAWASWDQSHVHPDKYQFKTKQEAADAIKTAAKVFGAVRCGITTNDKRFNYDPLYDIYEEKTLTWEDDFPFEPKSVIVCAVPQDYDGMTTAPTWTAEGCIANAYAKMGVLAHSLARFMQGLGYQAVGAGNDLGISPAYGIKAGLGEGGRHNQLMVPGYGPRVRLIKVYTDFDFVEYDQPRSWGMAEFCESCMKCAEACPSKALSFDKKMTYEPTFEHHDVPGYVWAPQVGVKKWYTDAQKCINFWSESDTDCGACTTACTFNEPDYWHHWFVMAINPFVPGFLHGIMADLHPAFGYGKTQNPAAVKRFWKTGRGMRVNRTNRHTYGATNIS